MKFTLRKFLFCFDLRTGGILIAIFNIIFSCVEMFLAVYGSFFGALEATCGPLPKYVLAAYLFLVINVLLANLLLFFSLGLLNGARYVSC